MNSVEGVVRQTLSILSTREAESQLIFQLAGFSKCGGEIEV